MATFGFILRQSPSIGENIETLYHLAATALSKDHEVFIFLYSDGVYTALKNQQAIPDRENPRDLLEDLVNSGANVIASNLDIKFRGIDSAKSYLNGVKTGGLPDLAEWLSKVDRLVSL